MAQVNFGIIDDGFPVTMKPKLEFSDIQRLTGVDEWGSEIDLRELNMQLVAKSVQFKGRINVNGFYNPEFFFSNQNHQCLTNGFCSPLSYVGNDRPDC